MGDRAAPKSGGSKRKANDEPEEKKDMSRRRIAEINKQLDIALKEAEREIFFLKMAIQIENLKREAAMLRMRLQKKNHLMQLR